MNMKCTPDKDETKQHRHDTACVEVRIDKKHPTGILLEK
jgi:hypothetical protein